MANTIDEMTASLGKIAQRTVPGASGASDLRQLSGGASYETWQFNAVTPKAKVPLILRRAPGGDRVHDTSLGPEGEAKLMQLAKPAGVPVPDVLHILTPADGIGRGFVQTFIEGETLGRKIVRDERFADLRKTLAYRCGEIMAKIHAIPTNDMPPTLRTASAQGRFNELYTRYKDIGRPRPVIALGFEWMRDHMPEEPAKPKLVHSDFRNGNIIFGEEDVRAILDWEIAHLGDPIEDLGWICVGPWRFGGVENPVGGFGKREDMVRGYEDAGGQKVPPDHLKFWEVLGSVSWGVSCGAMIRSIREGIDASSDRCMIARRASENEIDILDLLAPRSGMKA
jgi:aminoglycoside phosphotransferase (APT) family kinase protein